MPGDPKRQSDDLPRGWLSAMARGETQPPPFHRHILVWLSLWVAPTLALVAAGRSDEALAWAAAYAVSATTNPEVRR